MTNLNAKQKNALSKLTAEFKSFDHVEGVDGRTLNALVNKGLATKKSYHRSGYTYHQYKKGGFAS